MLDASAFYAGIPFASSQKHNTTPDVHDEVRHIKANHGAIDTLIDIGRLVIMSPSRESVHKVKQTAKNSGELCELSPADVSVIALCVEHSGRLITDDYAVSNVAKLMGIDVVPVMTRGTRQLRRWIRYCPSCKQDMGVEHRCGVCGGNAKRRPTYGS